MARPTKLNSDVTAKICDALKAGNTRRASAEYAGIAEKTFYLWVDAAEKRNASPELIQFLQAVKKAEADCEVSSVATIRKAGVGYPVVRTVTKEYKTPVKSPKGDIEYVDTVETTTTEYDEFSWQAAAWWLERRRPDDYKLRQATEHSGNLEIISQAAKSLDTKLLQSVGTVTAAEVAE